MSQLSKMKQSLNKIVISDLISKGFEGKYPFFRRRVGDKIELISFQSNKHGNSFLVECTAIFPNEQTDELRKFYLLPGETPEVRGEREDIIYSTLNRYRLKGMFDGWFYYTDVYKYPVRIGPFKKVTAYEGVGEKRAENYVKPEGYTQVQKIEDTSFDIIASEVLKQLGGAYKWWNKYDAPTRFRR